MVMGGAGGGNAPRNIMITIDNQTSGQVGAASGGGGGGTTEGGGGGGGRVDKKESKADKKTKDQKKDSGKSLKSLIGIDFGIAAMLKQSQIFTGFLGSVFQLIGALVDVILAPLAPYLFKMVEVVATYIPKVAMWSQKAVDWLKNIVDEVSGWVSLQTGINVSAGELVTKAFQIISLQGFASMIGSNFAASIMPGKEYNFKSFFKGVFSEDELFDGVKGAMKKGSVVIKNLMKMLKNIAATVMTIFGSKVLRIGAKFLKGAGTIGFLLGITFEIADIIEAFKEGEVGEAIFRIGMLVVGIGLPIVIGILATGVIPGLIAALVVGAAALAWEFLVPDDIKQKVYDWIEDLFKEIGDVFSELFSLGGSDTSVMSKVLNAILLVFNLPLTWLRLGLSLLLPEDMKRGVNEAIRNMASSLVNGLIGAINGIIAWVTETLIPKEINFMGMSWSLPQMGNFQIGEVDFSNFNVLMGTDKSVGGISGSEWGSRDMQMNMLQ